MISTSRSDNVESPSRGCRDCVDSSFSQLSSTKNVSVSSPPRGFCFEKPVKGNTTTGSRHSLSCIALARLTSTHVGAEAKAVPMLTSNDFSEEDVFVAGNVEGMPDISRRRALSGDDG